MFYIKAQFGSSEKDGSEKKEQVAVLVIRRLHPYSCWKMNTRNCAVRNGEEGIDLCGIEDVEITEAPCREVVCGRREKGTSQRSFVGFLFQKGRGCQGHVSSPEGRQRGKFGWEDHLGSLDADAGEIEQRRKLHAI